MVIWIAVKLDENSIMNESAKHSRYFTSREDAVKFIRSEVREAGCGRLNRFDDTNLPEVKWAIGGDGYATDFYLVQWNCTEHAYMYMANTPKLYKETYEMIYQAIAEEVISCQ